MKSKYILTTVVLILIAAAIAGIWFVKNPEPQALPEATESPLEGADFSLYYASDERIDFEALKKFGLPILIEYGTRTCPPCQQMAPILETLNKELAGKAFVISVDLDDHPQAGDNVPISYIPTQVFFCADGTPYRPSEELAAQLEFLHYRNRETEQTVLTTHVGYIPEELLRQVLTEMGVE